ncbi:glycine cleavage system protein R [Thiohalomonas denitrificans]|uniref:Glycine cleavage system transcriptional repressor n=1 Tax=Thiohalomonas denitrificans TaxID=415747 RepID=A0A1G5PZ04_9GAMM|nr:glycine cleavage system protein R [Thiohalomonas denitrificans]SCZ54773.1 glycine cleavage system transcriptional repressor [Thiohalomonas denitrificans]
MTQSKYLVISALGKDRPGIVDRLTGPVMEAGCNILDTRMTVLGGEFAILLMVEGSWAEVAKLEHLLPVLEKRLELTIIAKRTEERPDRTGGMPYLINVVSLDHPGIVNQIAGFFSTRNINIEDLYTESYRAAHTGTQMFSANITVNIPGDIHIAQLRNEFLDFCDSLNLDAVLEPVKG